MPLDKRKICQIGMLSVGGLLFLLHFLIPYFHSYHWISGFMAIFYSGDFVGPYTSHDGFLVFIFVLLMLSILPIAELIAVPFLRFSFMPVLNVCCSGYLVFVYFLACIKVSVSYSWFNGAVWILPFVAGAGLFFAIWELVMVHKGVGTRGLIPSLGSYRMGGSYSGYQQGPYYSNVYLQNQMGPTAGNRGYDHGAYSARNMAGYGQGSRQMGSNSGWLVGISGPAGGKSLQLYGGQKAVIGRDPAQCNMVLNDGRVSRVHCTVVYLAQQNCYQVTDLSSLGTMNRYGQRLPSNHPVNMMHGEELHIGGSVLQLR